MNELARPMPRPPAQVEPYFTALGLDVTVTFLLTFGGAELSLSRNPTCRSAVEALVGPEKAQALGAAIGGAGKHRVPLAKPWLARILQWQGQPTAQIARQLHVSDTSVRKWLKAAEAKRGPA